MCATWAPGWPPAVPELTRAEVRRAEPASPRPQTQPESPGRAGRRALGRPGHSGHTRGGGPSSQALKGAACWLTLSEGRESSLLFTSAASRAASSTAPRPFSIQRQLGQPSGPEHAQDISSKAPDTATLPSPSGPGQHLGQPLGPPESNLGAGCQDGSRRRGARGGARSPGPGREQATPGCGAGWLALTCQRGRTRVPWPRSRTRCQGQQGWAQTPAWTDFLLSWNRAAFKCRWFVKLDGSVKGAWELTQEFTELLLMV